MFVFLVILHILVCVMLVAVILMQAGRGEGLSGAFGTGFTQTLFGTRSATFLTRATAIIGGVFLVSALVLTFFSGYLNRSLMESRAVEQKKGTEPAAPAVTEQIKEKEVAPGAGPEEVTGSTEDKVNE